MGCGPSSAKDIRSAEDDAESQKVAKRQRRRLSVAPQHVKTKNSDQATAEVERKAGKAGLSEIEIRAMGRIKHASQTRKGVVPYNRNKVNQDRAIVKYALQDDEDLCLFGVMDGHGEFGHYVASFVQERLPVFLAQEDNLKNKTSEAITRAVHDTCEELSSTSINIAFSGTTAVFGVLVGLKLYVANIGDSRCVVARQTGAGDKYEAIGLTEDQKPENPSEKARIIQCGGRVEPLPGPPGEDCGPPRVWLAEVDVPGLAMSRSIGDEVSQTVGVISVPEITEHDVQKNDIFAIWASDGVWEFITNEEAVDIVWKYKHDLKAAANALVAESNRRWRREEEVVDDITCVIVGFNEAK